MLTFAQKIKKIIMHLFWIFPIKNTRISFVCYGGTQYSCNPKYISEYLYEKYKDKFELVWFYNNENLKKMIPSYVRKYKKNSFMYFYMLMTSKFVISNVTLPRVVAFRKKQKKINTWHGTAFKGDKNKFKNNYNMFDYFVAENDLTYNVLRLKDSFNYQGNVIKCGMPRNDILIRNEQSLISSIKQELNIGMEERIILYAPTFRESNDNTCFNIDFKRLLESLNKNWGGKWIILFRYHHLQKNKVFMENCIDVTHYPDMQRLMLISDILITDYSSTMWDFSLMKKPVFIYATDIERYIGEERGDFYFSLEKLPFNIAKSNEELITCIESFDTIVYKQELDEYHRQWGRYNYFGNATVEFVDKLICNK